MATDILRKLPEPSQYGTYWLGKPPAGPAVFTSCKKSSGEPQYFASLGNTVGGFAILTDPSGVRYFATPRAALAALREASDAA